MRINKELVVLLLVVCVVRGSACECATSVDELVPDSVLKGKAVTLGIDYITYGIGCSAHDAKRKFCTDRVNARDCTRFFPPPAGCMSKEWCQKEWCYVKDAAVCGAKASAAPFTSNMNTTGPLGFNRDRSISYAACKTTPPVASLDGVVLRLGLLANSGGWKGSQEVLGECGHGCYYNKVNGPVPDVFNSVQRENNFRVNVSFTKEEFPDYIVAQGGNAFTECARMVGLGMLDLCVGDFAVTTMRWSLTDFFILYKEEIILISPQSSNFSLESILLVYKPFKVELWACIILAVIVFAVVIQFQSYWHLAKQVGETSTWEKFILELREHIYWGFASVFSMGVRKFLPPTEGFGARITWVGFAWLVTLSSAMYLGETVTLLSQYRPDPEVSSIEEVLEKQLRVCVARATAMVILNQHPTIILARDPRDNAVGFYNRRDVFEAQAKGLCDVILALKQDLDIERSNGNYCNLVYDSTPILFENRGFPIGRKYARELTIAFETTISAGALQASFKRWKRADECPLRHMDNLKLSQLSGAFFSSVVLAFVGLCVTGMQLYMKRRAKAANHSKTGGVESNAIAILS